MMKKNKKEMKDEIKKAKIEVLNELIEGLKNGKKEVIKEDDSPFKTWDPTYRFYDEMIGFVEELKKEVEDEG